MKQYAYSMYRYRSYQATTMESKRCLLACLWLQKEKIVGKKEISPQQIAEG